jgi:hypothetical protein
MRPVQSLGFQSPKLSLIHVVANFVLLRYPDRMHFSMAFLVICFFRRDLVLHARLLWLQIMHVRSLPLVLHRLFPPAFATAVHIVEYGLCTLMFNLMATINTACLTYA